MEAAALIRRSPWTLKAWLHAARRAGQVKPEQLDYRPLGGPGSTVVLPNGRIVRKRRLYLRGDLVARIAQLHLGRMPAFLRRQQRAWRRARKG